MSIWKKFTRWLSGEPDPMPVIAPRTRASESGLTITAEDTRKRDIEISKLEREDPFMGGCVPPALRDNPPQGYQGYAGEKEYERKKKETRAKFEIGNKDSQPKRTETRKPSYEDRTWSPSSSGVPETGLGFLAGSTDLGSKSEPSSPFSGGGDFGGGGAGGSWSSDSGSSDSGSSSSDSSSSSSDSGGGGCD